MNVVYAGIAIGLILFIKPLVWVPLLFGLDRLAGLIGPKFRRKVSGHYSGQPFRYFLIAQYGGANAAQQDQERRSRAQRPATR